MKKLLRDKGLVEKEGGGGSLMRELTNPLSQSNLFMTWGFPNCFISFPSEKHVFITIGILFFVW